jgi:hypothetical protein
VTDHMLQVIAGVIKKSGGASMNCPSTWIDRVLEERRTLLDALKVVLDEKDNPVRYEEARDAIDFAESPVPEVGFGRSVKRSGALSRRRCRDLVHRPSLRRGAAGVLRSLLVRLWPLSRVPLPIPPRTGAGR